MTRQTSSSGWSNAHSENVIAQGCDNTGDGVGYDPAALYGIGCWQSYDPIGDTQGTRGLLAPPPLPVFPSNQAQNPDLPVTSSDQFDQLSNDIRSLAARVRNAAPQLDCDRIQTLQELFQSAFDDAFEPNMNLHTRPASSRQTGNPRSSEMYRCYLCQHPEATFSLRGSFKTHVATQHIPNYRYHCPGHCCPFFRHRKDRVRDHARAKHNLRGKRCEEKILSRAVKMPDPWACPLCRTPVTSWDQFFACVAHHCNVSDSHVADDNGSRRHDGSGGNGSGLGNQPFPGSGTGGTGNNNSQSGYGNPAGNVFSQAFYGAQGNYRGADFGHGGSPTDVFVAGQLPPNSSALPLGIDSAARSSNIHSGADDLAASTSTAMTVSSPGHGQSSRSIPRKTPATRTRSARQMHSARARDYSGAASLPVTPHANACRQASSGQKTKTPTNQRTALKRSCKSCGHIVDNCSPGRLLKDPTGLCHICAGRMLQQLDTRQNYGQQQGLAGEGAANKSTSASSLGGIADQTASTITPDFFSSFGLASDTGYSNMGLPSQGGPMQSQSNQLEISFADDPWVFPLSDTSVPSPVPEADDEVVCNTMLLPAASSPSMLDLPELGPAKPVNDMASFGKAGFVESGLSELTSLLPNLSTKDLYGPLKGLGISAAKCIPEPESDALGSHIMAADGQRNKPSKGTY
jgi:hypothetical protein